MHEDLRNAVADLMPALRQDLESLVRIPSVSAPGYDPGEVRRSADAVADLLAEAGFPETRLLEIEGAPLDLERLRRGDHFQVERLDGLERSVAHDRSDRVGTCLADRRGRRPTGTPRHLSLPSATGASTVEAAATTRLGSLFTQGQSGHCRDRPRSASRFSSRARKRSDRFTFPSSWRPITSYLRQM